MPKISVCIPTRNRAAILRLCIDSVLAQTMTDWEMIISDNASSDNTPEVIASYHDPRIRAIRHPENIGMGKNFNAVIQSATGDYVIMLMDDDVLLPEFLTEQSKVLDEQTNVAFTCTDYEVIDAEGAIIRNIYFHNDSHRIFTSSQSESGWSFISEYLLGHRAVGLPSSILFRRKLAVQCNFFDEHIGNPLDADLWLRLSRLGDFYYLDKKLLLMRWHDNLSKKLTAGPTGYRDIYSLTKKHLQLNAEREDITDHAVAMYGRLVRLMLPYYTQALAKDRLEIISDFNGLPLPLPQRLILTTQLFWLRLTHPNRT